ncbi:MAG: hypothetical protein LBK77_05340 [Spirochaetaceae bacterium]|jgi:hypothetical protein|nr:hypothetical protein [Spirochaetaceae bacterium]
MGANGKRFLKIPPWPRSPVRSIRIPRCFAAFLCGLFFAPLPRLTAQDSRIFPDTGDGAIALRYLEWAQKELAAGRRAEALAALERSAGYAPVSSDLSYFLALVRSLEGRPRGSVLEACRLALETGRWARYTPETARLLEAKTLTDLRRFEEALAVLRSCNDETYDTRNLKLRALRGLAFQGAPGAEAEFAAQLRAVMDRFPRETGPVRLLFEYAAFRGNGAGAAGRDVPGVLREPVDLALRRLPALLETDAELACLAAPFMLHAEDARRYVSAYRAAHGPGPGSISPALDLGLIDGFRAAEDLFAPKFAAAPGGADPETVPPELDRDLLARVWELLRNDGERGEVRRNLLRFTGVITEDRDHDGIPEARTVYREGLIVSYGYDADQDGLEDLSVNFARGLPEKAVIALFRDGPPALPLNDRSLAELCWERYPMVRYTDLRGRRYLPGLLEYAYTPFRLRGLVPGGPDYPVREEPLPVLTERSLLSFAVLLEQPSGEFPGGIERVELSGSLPVRSAIYLKERLVSETEYSLGRPVVQHADLDLDGRMETVRRYGPEGTVRITESDWDGDGIYEYAETVQDDGTVKKSWDFNKDGIRETEG